MSPIPDPIRAGLAKGWKVYGGDRPPAPEVLSCDVLIVGTGAGGGITAELLSAAGLNVIMVEEGPLRSSTDFRQSEADAYPTLYQESASRKTADQAIGILQGRAVGGSTTVNWTSSFRTPPETLAWWRGHFALKDLGPDALDPWFAQVEQRLSMAPWAGTPNANNSRLRDGAAKLGIPTAVIPRNVKGCWDLGSCGLGCPTNAKQSMLLTTVPAALDRGATLLVQVRADKLEFEGRRVKAVRCVPVALDASATGAAGTRIEARHVVLAGGAINTPALLLRSQAPDPHDRLGQRTFLHPTVLSRALFDEPIEAWQGAPQTIYSDHFLHTQPIDGPLGFKLEVPPLHPALSASTMPGFGLAQTQVLRAFPRSQAVLALIRDGFHPDSPGGRVKLRSDGSGLLDYPLTAALWEAARRALRAMAEIQFAAGARSVLPFHEQARDYLSWDEARAGIDGLVMAPYKTRVVSAHVMGGCGMAGNAELGVCRPDGRHWQLENLSVHDGSLFPTSIGANPQLSIYGLVNKLATGLAAELGGKAVSLA